MAKFGLLLLLTLVAGCFAGRIYNPTLPKCSSKCSASSLQKFIYQTSKTYQYRYEGESQVNLKGVPGAETQLEWEALVDVSFISPCDLAVVVKSQKFKGQNERSEYEDQMTKHPLVVAMSDGVVTEVCADPEDLPASLNLKKGIVSNLQNTLPSLAKIHSGKTFTEVDINGRCPTLYDVEISSPSRVEVIKRKEHKQCQDRYGSQVENPMTSWWMNAPLPLESSNSTCVQKIQDQIVTEVKCKDINVIKPFVGSYKYVTAVQKSNLKLLDVKSGISVPPMDSIRYTNLTAEFNLEPKSEQVVSEVEQILRQLCQKVQKDMKEDAARTLAKTISLLYRLPEQQFKQIIQKVKDGKYCASPKRLEEILLDAIAFSNNAGAVKVMVEELLKDQSIGGRTPLYTIALHLMKRPCLRSVQAVVPLFESERSPAVSQLAAGSLLGKYCKEHPNALSERPVIEAMESLERNLERSCKSSKESQEKKTKALITLKVIGNMANMTGSLEQQVLQCAKSQESDVAVRIAAAQSFRSCNCTGQMTKVLKRQALDKSEQTEVRIASYLAAIRCADLKQAQEIVDKISEEPSSQVRSFILSHLRNLQSSDAPYLQDQRYNLTRFVIPSDYEFDFRRFSRNIDLSYYMPTLGLGGGVDTSVVYTPKSYLPRQLQTNITLDLLNNVINIGEFGIRVQDLESIVERLVGPEGYLRRTPLPEIIKDVTKLVKEKAKQINEILNEELNSNRERRVPSVEEITKWIQESGEGSQRPVVDAFARVLGREIGFVSTKMGLPSEEKINKIINKIIQIATSIFFESLNKEVETARAAQLNYEFFIPTAQGIPVQLKFVATGIAGLKGKSDINTQSTIETQVRITPEVSIHMNGFIGYNLGAKSGLRQNATIYSSSEIEVKVDMGENNGAIKVDLPRKSQAIKTLFSTYMMKKFPGQADIRYKPRSSSPVIKKDDCSEKIQKALGLQVCYKVEVPRYTQSGNYPLGNIVADVTVQKTLQKEPVLTTKAKWVKSPEMRELSLDVKAPAAQTPRKLEAQVSFESKSNRQSVLLFTRIPEANIKRAVKVELEKMSSSSGLKYEVDVYSSEQPKFSSSDKVIEVLVGGNKNTEKVSGQLMVKTMKPLSEYVAADIDVDATIYRHQTHKYLPKSLSLRKFHVDVELMRDIRSVNSIKRSFVSGESVYHVVSKAEFGPKTLYSIEGQGKVQGELLNLDMESSFKAQVSLPEQSYETTGEFILSEKRNKTLLLIKKSSGDKVMQVESEIVQKSQTTKEISAQLQVPKYLPKYSVEGQAKRQDRETQQVQLVLKKRDEPIFKVEGPITAVKNEEKALLQTHLNIKCMRSSQEISLISKLLKSQYEKEALIQITKERQDLLKAQAILRQKGEEQYASSVVLYVPRLVDLKTTMDKTQSKLEIGSNSLIFPSTQKSRRVKYQLAIDTEEKKLSGNLYLDADRDQTKSFHFDTTYDISVQRRSAFLKGEAKYHQKEYKITIETVLDMLRALPQDQRKNLLSVHIVNPSQETFQLVIKSQVERDSSERTSVQLESKLKTYKKLYFDIKSSHKYEYASSPLKLVVQGSAQMKVGKLSPVTLTVNNYLREEAKEAKISMQLEGPSFEKPVDVEIEVRYPLQNPKAKILLDLESILDAKIESETEVSIERRPLSLRKLVSRSEIKLPRNEYSLSLKATPSEPVEFVLKKNRSPILETRYEKIGEEEWKVEVTSQSREMEIRSQKTNEKMVLSVYPDAKNREQRYEAGLTHSRRTNVFSGSQSIESMLRARYPGSEREMRIISSLELTKEQSKGIVELDIFENQEDKMVLDIKTFKRPLSTYEIIADIKLPRQSERPQLMSVVSFTPEVKRFDLILLKDTKATRPELDVSLAYYKTTPENGNFYALLKTPRVKYETTAVVQPQKLFSCMGASLNGTVHGTHIGSVDFASAVCAPAYIEFGLKPSHKQDMTVTKIGLRSPASIKLAIDKVYNSTEVLSRESITLFEPTLRLYGQPQYVPKKPVLLLGAKLFTPMMVSLGAKYDTSAIKQYVKDAEEAMEKISKVYEEIFKEMPKEIAESTFGQSQVRLSPELRAIKQELKEKVRQAREELKEILPNRESIEEAKQKVRKVYREAEEKFADVVRDLEQLVEDIAGMSIEEIQQKLKELEEKYKEKLQKYKKLYEDVVREIKKIIKIIEEEGLQGLKEHKMIRAIRPYLRSSSIWNWIVDHFHHIVYSIKEDIRGIEHMFKHFWKSIGYDLENIIQRLMEIPSVKKLVDWVISWFKPDDFLDINYTKEAWKLTKNAFPVAMKLMGLYATPKIGAVSVEIPLKTPVSSIRAAVESIGIPSYVYRHPYQSWYIRSMRYNMMSAYSRPAVLKEREVRTFDGLVIPFQPSQCKILLAKDQDNNKVYVEKRSPQEAKLIVVPSQGPKVQVSIEKDQPIRVRGLSNGQLRSRHLNVTQESQQEVQISLRSFEVEVQETEIVVRPRPWAFSQLSGLMGENNSEIADEIPKGASVRYHKHEGRYVLDKSSARKVLNKFRENKSCQI